MSDKWLFFVDTNVFLDFYRMPGSSVTRQLAGLESHVDRLIFGDQLRMEFFKNRQKVIQKAVQELKKPAGGTSIPQVFSGLKVSEMMTKHLKDAQARYKDLSVKAEKLLPAPSHNDPIYSSFNRIFRKNTPLNLRRPDPVRFTVRNRARKRFILGYPPRKSNDTSIGDSVNWEWIIECACSHDDKPNIMIVSRDGDYGIKTDGGTYLNDWLEKEFKERVSNKRKIVLTTKLTDALKLMDEVVPQEDIEAELNLSSQALSKDDYGRPLTREEFENYLSEIKDFSEHD